MKELIRDHIAELGFEAMKNRINNKFDEQQLRERLKLYLDKQKKYNFDCTREEELDFQGIVEYIQNDLLSDVQLRLFGNKQERRMARESIISSAVKHAQAHTKLAQKRVIDLVAAAIDILRAFYTWKADRELLLIAGRIEDTVIEEVEVIVENAVKSEIDRVDKAIEQQAIMSIDRNVHLMRTGKTEEVETAINDFLNGLSATHDLRPDYGYALRTTGEKQELYSKPQTDAARSKYPPKMVCTGDIFMNGMPINRLTRDTLEYANRHQLSITIDIIAAQKFLGEYPDPIQHEAKRLVGEKLTIPPKPFPPATPCSIALDDKVLFDYVCLRAEEVMDDGTIVLSNHEQSTCTYRFNMKANLERKSLVMTIKIEDANNEEMLKYLQFIKGLADGKTLSIKDLKRGDVFISGSFEDFVYDSGFDSIEDEIDFLERVVAIEKSFTQPILLPNDITVGDDSIVSYLAAIVRGEECTGSWKSLDLNLIIADNTRAAINKMKEEPLNLSYVGTISVTAFGNEYKVRIHRTFMSAIVTDLERLKKKLEYLDDGDRVKIHFLPHNKSDSEFIDRMYRDEVNSETMFEITPVDN